MSYYRVPYCNDIYSSCGQIRPHLSSYLATSNGLRERDKSSPGLGGHLLVVCGPLRLVLFRGNNLYLMPGAQTAVQVPCPVHLEPMYDFLAQLVALARCHESELT